MDESSHAPPVLLFDGTCVLCNAFFQWVLKVDKKKVFFFATIQSDYGQTIIANNDLSLGVDTVILYYCGRPYLYSDAALRVGILLGGFYKLLGTIGLWLPRWIRDSVYKFVARHRYNWFGQKDCMIPSPDVKARFTQS